MFGTECMIPNTVELVPSLYGALPMWLKVDYRHVCTVSISPSKRRHESQHINNRTTVVRHSHRIPSEFGSFSRSGQGNCHL